MQSVGEIYLRKKIKRTVKRFSDYFPGTKEYSLEAILRQKVVSSSLSKQEVIADTRVRYALLHVSYKEIIIVNYMPERVYVIFTR